MLKAALGSQRTFMAWPPELGWNYAPKAVMKKGSIRSSVLLFSAGFLSRFSGFHKAACSAGQGRQQAPCARQPPLMIFLGLLSCCQHGVIIPHP